MRGYVTAIIICAALAALCLPSPRPDRNTVVNAVLDGDAAAVRAAAARGFDVAGDPSLLAFAAASGRFATVRMLLELGANPNPTGGVVSPLIMAAANGHTDVVHQLLKFGADPSHRNGAGDTAYAVARSRGHPETAELLRRWECRSGRGFERFRSEENRSKEAPVHSLGSNSVGLRAAARPSLSFNS